MLSEEISRPDRHCSINQSHVWRDVTKGQDLGFGIFGWWMVS